MHPRVPKKVLVLSHHESKDKEKELQTDPARSNSSTSASKSMSDLEKTDTAPTNTGQPQENQSDEMKRVQSTTSLSGLNSLPTLTKTNTMRTIGRLTLRGENDDLPQSWWFASTAIPLLAATIGPLANVLSIAALVTSWRDQLQDNGTLPAGSDELGVGIEDPRWEIILNAISLVCGFGGNFFLLLNFTKKVRYIVALPVSIILWFVATGILTGIVIAMHVYDPPISPGQTYSQGFWHAVLACILYMILAVILMINMLGYALGHYSQHFELDDSQRTLILQTMMFFFWLAAGAGIFAKLCGFSYSDALYFCDVTVLTIGYGDFVPTNDGARGFVFPYTVIGIIFLGLMINSIHKFTASMSKDKVIKAHALHERARTIGRTVTSENELRDRLGLPPRASVDGGRRSSNARKGSATGGATKDARLNSLTQYGRFEIQGRTVTFHEYKTPVGGGGRGGAGRSSTPKKALSRDEKMRLRSRTTGSHARRHDRRQKLLLLKEEKDRFDAMREIQSNTRKFKQYYALAMSALAFGILWCAGAVVFMLAEHREQGMSYFQALYFCYVSLLTIGYGDFSPKSNVGKAFFVVWSLLAVPTMTILISDMGDTVVAAINRGTFTLADWTVMPRQGAWHDFLESHERIRAWLEKKNSEIEAKKRLKAGFDLASPDMDIEGSGSKGDMIAALQAEPPTLEQLASKTVLSDHELARKLAITIKRTAQDLHAVPPKKYSYEEWVEFTQLIRFSAKSKEEVFVEEEEEGLVEWDWIGEDSPMLSDVSESEWVLDRLCESLNRYTRRQAAMNRQLEEAKAPAPGPRRLSIEKEEDEDQITPDPDPNAATGTEKSAVAGTAAGQNPQQQQQDRQHGHHAYGYERHSHHGHGAGHSHGLDARGALIDLHHLTESEAVREWEARIARSRAEARRRREGGSAEGEGEKIEEIVKREGSE